MRAAVALGLLTALAVAGVEAPLGPFVRAGVPLPLRADQDTRISVRGWTFDLPAGEITYIAPAFAPATVLDESGKELLRLEDVIGPDRIVLWKLVAVFGSAAPRFRERLEALNQNPVRVVELDPKGDLPARWQAYDVFDRIYVLVDPGSISPQNWETLVTWVRGGGEILVIGNLPSGLSEEEGLGSALAVEDMDGLFEVGFHGWPPDPWRNRTARGDLYDGLEPAWPSAAPLNTVRGVVLATGSVFLILLLLGARFRTDRRAVLGGILVVSVAGGVVGLVLAAAHYGPVAEGRIEELLIRGTAERHRIYHVRTTLRPGRAPEARDGETPVPYSDRDRPWWPAPGEGVDVDEGVTRIFLEERVVIRESPRPWPETSSDMPYRLPNGHATDGPEPPIIGGSWWFLPPRN